MKRNEWIILIILIIVISAVVAYITGAITGNVINLNQDRWGKYQVYTKAEIDAFITEIDDTITRIYTMIDGRTSNQNILTMLENNCITTNSLLYNISSITGAKVCDSYNLQYQKNTTCISVQQGRSSSVIVPCNSNLGINMTIPNYVMCCSP